MKPEPVKYEHKIPASLHEARDRRTVLTAEIDDIQMQLGDRNKIDPATGERVSSVDYWQWKKKAQQALRHRSSELRFLNDWIRENSQTDSITSLLKHLLNPEPMSEATLLLVMHHQEELLQLLHEVENKILSASEDYLSKRLPVKGEMAEIPDNPPGTPHYVLREK